MRRAHRAFTLIELLVVVAIIGILVSILLPSLGKARAMAKQARTASDMHQMMLAYKEYSTDNDGHVLLGFLPDSANWVVQDDQYGTTVSGHPATRYPWRFLPYVRDWRILFNNTPMDSATVDAFSYQLSLLPRFGLNSAFVGGDHEYGGFDGANNPNPSGGGGGPVVFRDVDARQPAGLIVFAETACVANGQLFAFPSGTLPAGCPPEDLQQYFQLVPPKYGSTQNWHVGPATGGIAVIPDAPSIMGVPYSYNTKKSVTGFFDGHAEAMNLTDLQDMRLWSIAPQ